MNQRFFRIIPQPWAQIALLVGLCLVIYFVNLGQWDLWNPDEPRYAEVSREMVKGGDWILMYYNGEVYSDKPPLFFWAIAFSSSLWQGFNSFSVRFPSALFGTLTVLLTFFIGKRLYSSRTGFLSGLILATSVQFAYLSTRANIDTTLTFFITASLLCFFLWYRHSREEKNEKGDLRWCFIYGFYIGMALATLTKGPVGFILPFLVSLIYLVLRKDWRGIKEMRLFPGLPLFLGIVLCWYLPAVWKGGIDYLSQTLFFHSLSRYTEGWAKPRPIYYYFFNFPASFIPWIIFLPSAFVYVYSKENIEKRKELFFLVVWFVVIFIFFSLSKGKRTLYLLPLFPAASLLVGKFLHDLIATKMDYFRKGWVFLPIYVLMGGMLVAGAVLPWVVSIKFPFYLYLSLPLVFLLVGGSLSMFVLYRLKSYGTLFFLFIGILAAGYFYSTRAVFPFLNQDKSARFISQEITSRIQSGEKLAVYGRVSTAPYNFYTGIVPILNLIDQKDLLQFLNVSERVFCLLTVNDLLDLQKVEGKPEVHLIARQGIRREKVVLISNYSDKGRNL